ncbi:condensin complex protein MksE [Kangiella koreensis]|uniref:Type IIA topoisomerase (DNA gyrase/topo II topoisomerase IV) A subunit-like protein n=1 Tax=Kangiella koreensis (strain DSM 16069 / JCM 12317 / KCTC 12182 / SW-125) TaxID=523791 RepID=C7R636_KANKD|nr:hypothetical protein [Kangiella koreensis]ACV25467.1 type IIA topoisomerase (DNA gyrase/topo II topoisomerase IV) A subunit-like protein [Kangiella koreensis DSM 16069]
MNDFDLGLDVFDSRAIYKDFMAGKIINKYEIIEGELQRSPKFGALIGSLDIYRYLYSLIGFEIKQINDEAYFITRIDRADEYNEVAANIQVLLTVICRGVYSLGLPPGILLDQDAGLTSKQIDEIGLIDEQKRILKACGLKTPLSETVNGKLVDRGVFLKTQAERYILSSAGKYLYEEIISDTETRALERITE